MRRLALGLSFLLLFIIGQPISAQGNVVDFIKNRRDLSTFALFLDAARPSVVDELRTGGPYTVFAPNNIAFANLASALNLSLAELLQNPEVVTQFVQYHVMPTERNERQLRQLNGQIVPSLLRGAFINIRISDNDTISVNNVVEVIETDLRAGNGTVHIVNDVLLNRIIAQTIDEANALITPNPQATLVSSTETPVEVQTPVSTPEAALVQIPVANVRLAQLAPSSEAVDLYINDELLIAALPYAQVSDFISLAPATYTLALAPAGTSLDAAILGPFEVTLDNQAFLTLALIGSGETLTLDAITEDYNPLAESSSRLLFYHAVEGLHSLTISSSDALLLENLDYAASGSIDFSAGAYTLMISLAESPSEALITSEEIDLTTGMYMLAVVSGAGDSPELILQGIDTATAAALRNGDALAEPSEVISATSEQSLIEILTANDDFSILVEMLDAADDEVYERLGSERGESITLLAPTNEAFENLFSSVNRSKARFLANPDLVTDILLYHMIEGQVLIADFRAAAGTSIITRLPANQAFFVTVSDDGAVLLNNSVRFLQTDLQANNGVIHVIDNLLLPQSVMRTLGG